MPACFMLLFALANQIAETCSSSHSLREAEPPKLHPLHFTFQIRRVVVVFQNTSSAISS